MLKFGHPVRVLVLLSLFTLAFACQLPKLRTEFGYRPLLGEEHPSIQVLDGFIERFGGGFPVQIAWSCRESPHCETIFDPASLRMADTVSRRLASLAVIRDVRSPASSSLLVPTDDGFEVRRFVERGEPVADARLLAERVLDDPLWVGNLVSRDGVTGVIVVQPVDSESETITFMISNTYTTTPLISQGLASTWQARGPISRPISCPPDPLKIG